MFSAAKLKKIYSVLENYNGDNNQIMYYKYKYEKGTFEVTDFSGEYILSNKNYKTKEINKTVKISMDFGDKLRKEYDLDFIPVKLKITKIIGEIGNSYHCYAQFRRSVPPKLMFVNKNYILNDIPVHEKFEIGEIDFDKYDKKTEHIGRKLKEHQKEAVRFLLTNRKCILADEMGCGKTTSAIVAAIEGGFKKVLIVTTASVKTSWKRELMLYEDEENITIMSGSKWSNPNKFTITNYDILQNFYSIPYEQVEEVNQETGEVTYKLKKSNKKKVIKENLDKSPLFQEHFDCVIIDEAHKLSNRTSIRYKVMYDFLHRAKPNAVFLLTGTPLTKRPINLYHVLKLIDADITKDYMYYCMRYCDGKKLKLRTGKEVMLNNGASNLDELKEKIKHLYIRRLQSDVNDLVEKTVITKEYDLNDKQKEEYDKLWGDYLEAQKLAGNEDVEQYKDLVEGMLVRQYLAMEMIPNTIELADSKLNYDEKVIIVCTFQEELEVFQKHYKGKAVIFNGKMTTKEKDKAVDEFMNNPKVTVFICNLVAASVGLTLTSSNIIIFNSYSFSATDNEQMEYRIYRLNQTKDVTCVYQLFTDSISKDMFDKVNYKKQIIRETIKSEIEKHED